MKICISILLSALLTLSCSTQGEFPGSRPCEAISDHLSNPSVTAICLDSLQRVWIGTERGLNRFNGYDFHQYLFTGDSTGIPGNHISDIILDQKGRVWIGTEDGVAVFTDKEGFKRIPVHSKEKTVHQILCPGDGRIFLNMMEDFCVLDSDTGSFESRIPQIDRYHSYCQKCYLDSAGHLWSVASLELRCFDASSLSCVENYSTLDFVVTSTMLSNGEIWMSGRKNLAVFDTKTARYISLPSSIAKCKELQSKDIEFISEADSTRVLLKTSDGMVFCYDRAQDTLDKITFAQLRIPSDFALKDIRKDTAGRLWMSSDNNGFLVRPPLRELKRTGLSTGELDSASIVSASMDSKGDIWLYSLHDGLFHYDAEKGQLSKPAIDILPTKDSSSFMHNNNPLVMADSSGCIWLAHSNRRSIMKGRLRNGGIDVEEEHLLYYPRVAICDSDGGVWIGTYNYYIHHARPEGGPLQAIQVYPAQTTQITCLVEYGSNIVVGAYNEPLMMVDRKTLQTQLLPVQPEDYSKCTTHGYFYPTVMRVDSAGNLLIGTRFNGLLRYDSSSRHLYKEEGGPMTDVSSIEQTRDGQLWVSTPGGIFINKPNDKSWQDYFSPDISGGTFFYDRASVGSKGSYLLFGTSRGIVVINPETTRSGCNARVFFEDIKLGNKSYSFGAGSRLVLSHRNNSAGVTFAAPDYLDLGEIRYKYNLDGAGNQWIETGSGREIYLNNLRSGKHRLRVCHFTGQDNVLSESALEILVRPHPLLSFPAIAAYVLIMLLVCSFLFKIRSRIQAEKRLAHEAEFEKEQQKRTNRMNMAFFSNVSHEFRTPLTLISGPISQLAQDSNLSRKDKYLLSLVRNNVNRMLSLVNQLMDFSKMENSTLELKTVHADIVPVISETMALFKVNAESLGIKILEQGLEYPLTAWFDADKIQKIIGNLMSNALKFTPRGGIVTLELDEQIIDDKNYLRIAVADTGKGIPEDKLENVFDRYYQLQNSVMRPGHYGTGIGLFYARSLAHNHHGTLTAANRREGGAIFTLLIPNWDKAYLEKEKSFPGEEASLSRRFPVETVPAMTSDTGILKDQFPMILAVDDDPDILRYLVSLFSEKYRVATATSATEALSMAIQTAPDIILCDVVMPGKDGFQFCREIKEDLQLCHIPVILVTAMGTMENQVEGLDQGADAYVTKPFDPTYLKSLVRSQLENRRRIQNLVNSATGSSSLESINGKDKAFLELLYGYMEAELSNEELDIAQLASMLKISRTKFYYKMKGLTGKSPSEFFKQYKLNVAAKLLLEGKLNVSEVSIKTGFVSIAHFSKSFKKQFGVSPSKYTG